MGVYIKVMEMPKDCKHCRFSTGCSFCEGFHDHCVLEPDSVETEWDFSDGVFPNSIPDWCPLVPVPPHGRLIDADALISGCKDEKGSYYGHDSAVIGEAVESAPTVIEAEE